MDVELILQAGGFTTGVSPLSRVLGSDNESISCRRSRPCLSFDRQTTKQLMKNIAIQREPFFFGVRFSLCVYQSVAGDRSCD